MSATSSIEWTDRTWNPVRGCSIVSPGCVNCYAMKQAHRFSGPGRAYEGLTKQTKAGPQWTGTIALVADALLQPLSWKQPQRVFVNSMSDLFHEGVPFEFIDKVFGIMACCPQHTFQILTKRPGRMLGWVTQGFEHERVHEAAKAILGFHHPKRRAVNTGDWPLRNVWLGVSCEDQLRADERIPLLLKTPAKVRFISAEPLLGPITLDRLTCVQCQLSFDSRIVPGRGQTCPHCGHEEYERLHRRWLYPMYEELPLDWVIVGGESGAKARLCAVDWIKHIVQQCREADVASFVKQVGTRPCLTGPCALDEWTNPCRVTAVSGGIEIVLKDRKGGDPAEWPEALRVRDFPG